MYTRDYIMRLIEQMAQFIGRVSGLRRENKHTEALWEIDEQYLRLFRLNGRLARSMPPEDLIGMFTTSGVPETEQLQCIAALLKEEGEIYRELGKMEESVPRQVKALHLFVFSALHGADAKLFPTNEEIERLVAELRMYLLPAQVQRLLMAYYEQRGQFAKAEDVLFELLDRKEDVAEAGLSFYERLLSLGDGELERGGLPRGEVEMGLDQFRQYIKA